MTCLQVIADQEKTMPNNIEVKAKYLESSLAK